MADTDTYPMILDFGHQGKEVFKSNQEVIAFFKAEVSAWSWLWSSQVSVSNGNNLWPISLQDYLNGLADIAKTMNNVALRGLNGDDIDSLCKKYRDDLIFKSKSPKGMFILSIGRDVDSARSTVGAFLQFSKLKLRDKNVQALFGQDMLSGAFLANSFLKKGKSVDLTVVSDAYEEACNKIIKNQTDLSDFISKSEIKYSNIATEREHFVIHKNEEHEENLKNWREEFSNLKETYFEALKLKAPAKYWKDEERKHLKMHWIWMGLTSAFFVAVMFFLYFYIHDILPKFIEDVLAKKEKMADFQYIYIFAALTVMTVIFWVGRILTRMMLSERHLATDAAERSVMAETYLALVHEHGAEKEERPLVLASLFRNSSDGIVKDDNSADISLSAIVSKMMMPK